MASQNVMRVNRQDQDGFVLLSVSAGGPQPLDVTLVATENEHPYYAQLKNDRISELRGNKIDEQKWIAALSWTLLKSKPGKHSELIDSIDAGAIVEEQSIKITLRQNVGGITQRLGSITLNQDDDQELDLFEWAGVCADSASNAEKKVAALQRQRDEQQSTIDKLNSQMESFISAKKQHEDEMLGKFRQLLNTKKLKIRDQQRLLAGAKVNSDEASGVHNARSEGRAHDDAKGPGRAAKRKAKYAPAEDQALDEPGDEEAGDGDVGTAQTPDRSESPPPPHREMPLTRRAAQEREGTPDRSDDEDAETDDEL